jgi:uncharacterized repeat protein (TIGR01451 family)
MPGQRHRHSGKKKETSMATPSNFIRSTAACLALPALLAGCGGDSTPAPAASPAVVSTSESVGSATATVGDRVTWTIAVNNSGAGATTGTTTLVATVPGNLSGVSVVPNGVACGPAVSTLTCTIAAGFAPGASASVIVSGTATAVGNLTSAVVPSGAGAASCESTADCSTTTAVAAAPVPPNVTVSASVDKTSTAIGNTINWTLTALDTGGATTAAITLTDTLPASGIGAVTVTPTGASCDPVSGNTLTCTIPAGLAATHGTATVLVSAPATAAASLVNTVAPGAGASCSTPASCTTTTSVASVAAANVTVTSSVNKTVGFIGDAISWTLTAANSGTGASTAPITLTDTLPAGGIGTINVTPTGASCNAVTGNTLSCTIPTGLAAGGGTAQVVIATTANNSGTLVNTVVPGTGASCTVASDCTKTTLISSAATQVAGSCGVMMDAATLNGTFGGTSGTLVALTALGTTSTAGPNIATYVAGLASTGDPANLESWPGSPNGPGSGTMVTASGQQFICASENGSATTGASSTVKYTSDLTSGTSPTISLAGNIQISKVVGSNPGFVMFNLPSLTNFSFEFFRSGSNGYQLDYTTDGTTWHNVVTTSSSRATCTTPSTAVCDELNLLTSSPSGAGSFTATAPITQPVVLRLSNINPSGTMVIQKVMIKP